MANLSRLALEFGGLLTTPAETKIPAGRCWACSNVDVETGILKARRGYALYGARTSANAGDLGWGLGYGRYSADAVQILSLTGSPTSGTVVLKWRQIVSGAYVDLPALNWNATAAELQAALVSITGISDGDVECSGGPWPALPIQLTWRKRYAGQAVLAPVLKTNSLSGGSTPTYASVDKITGGDAEEWLVALQKNGETTVTMFSVTNSGATWTEVATGLTASDWFFAQYAGKIFACNATDGLHFKVLGGLWDGAAVGGGGGGGGSVPAAPTRGFALNWVDAPSTASGGLTSPWSASPWPYPFQDATTPANTYAFTSWGTNPTVAGTTTGFVLTPGTALANGSVSIDVTLASAVDLSHMDMYQVQLTSSDGTAMYFDEQSMTFELLNGTTVIEPIYIERFNDSGFQNPAGARFYFGSNDRTHRTAVNKIRLRFGINIVTTGKKLDISIFAGRTFLFNSNANLSEIWRRWTRPSNFVYAYSYFQVSGGAESALGTVFPGTAPNASVVNRGWWQLLKPYGTSALTNSDKIHLYRRDSRGDWRLVDRVSNDNTGAAVIAFDKYMDEELTSLPQYGDLGGGGPTGGGASTEVSADFSPRVLGLWKQALVLGFRRQAWLSAQGIPDLFAPSPDDTSAPPPDDTDETRGVTTYVSDDRSETVTGIVGEDSLYLVTPQSAYAVVGDRPAGSSFPRRLPTSRGGLGTRAQCNFGGGAQIGSQDGVWYYSVGRGFNGQDNGALTRREETEEVRSTWTTFVASNASRTVVASWNDETWAFNGTAYLMRSRSGRWSTGTFADSVKAVFASPYVGFKFLDSKGRIMTLSASYTTDAGTAIAWNYETGWLESERAQIKKIFLWGAGSPTMQVFWDDGSGSNNATFSKPASRVAIPGLTVKPAFRYKLKLAGTSNSDTVESCSLLSEEAPGGWGN